MEQTRRVLEYVTLANAFMLVVSLAWLHTRFVNPKGGQGSAVSCLPAALARAGVDPAQLHVLQIHIRLPPDDRGGVGSAGGGSSGSSVGRRKNLLFSPDGSSSSGKTYGGSRESSGPTSDPYRHRGSYAGEAGEGAGNSCSGMDDRSANGLANAGGGAIVAGGGGVFAGAGGGAASAGVSGSGGDSSSGLESTEPSPEIFYSIKLVTGKDAVGTLSGPGTLGIERCVTGAGEGRAAGCVDGGGGSGGGGGGDGDGGGGAVCGAAIEDKRSTVVQTLVDAFSWGKGGEAAVSAGAIAAAERGREDAGPPPPGSAGTVGRRTQQQWRDGDAGGLLQHVGGGVPLDGPNAGCAAAGETTPADDVRMRFQEYQQHQRGEAAGEGEEAAGAGEQRFQDEVYLYSLEKGFLMLRPDLRRKHGIVTANVTVSAHDPCIGGTVVQALVKDFVGYDTVVMNWLISLYGGRGFLYGVHNNELFNLNYAAEFVESTEDMGKFAVFKIGVLFTTLFLFFTTTTLVSFTLRETQERMLKFTFLLQHHVRHRLPYAPLIFTHVVESLVFVPIMVGILFFLFEFFSDQLLAFMVLSVVWLCEVYSVVSVRTSVCIRFFPQVFFLYFTLFHIYFFSFPFGFSYLALVTTVLFLQHSMLFCWNRYEVPALRTGVVSASRPRQAGMVIGVVPRYDPHGMVLPLVPRPSPGGGISSGGGASAPAWGRQRAATASSLEEPREWQQPPVAQAAPRAAERVITRSNSSPDPAPMGSSRSLGGEGYGDGDGDGDGVDAAAAADPPSVTTPVQPASRPTPARQPEAEWPLPRGWGEGNSSNSGGAGSGGAGSGGAGSGGAGTGGSLDGSAGNSTRRDVSAPLLGSFPFSVWDMMQMQMQTTEPASTQGTDAGSRPVAEASRRRRREGATNGTGTDGGRRDAGAAAGRDGHGLAEKAAAAGATTTPVTAVVLDGIQAREACSVSGGSTCRPGETTNSPEEPALKIFEAAAAAAAAASANAPAAGGRDGGGPPSPRNSVDTTGAPGTGPSPGPADGGGLVFGGGGQGRQQQQPLRFSRDSPLQLQEEEQELLLRREDDDGTS